MPLSSNGIEPNYQSLVKPPWYFIVLLNPFDKLHQGCKLIVMQGAGRFSYSVIVISTVAC